MKSRKMFAILTLIAFTMTLVPALAFGVAYNQDASEVIWKDKSVKVTTDDAKRKYAKVYVEFRDNDNKLITNSPIDLVWVKSSMTTVKVDVEKEFVVGATAATSKAFSVEEGIVNFDSLQTDANGEVEFKFYSSVAGEVELGFWFTNPSKNKIGTVDGVDYNSFYCIGKGTINFTADEGKADAVTIKVEAEDEKVGKEIKLTARVLDAKQNGISDEKVTFYKKKGASGSWVNIGQEKTDRRGSAELKYYEEDAGKYNFRARVAGTNYDIYDVDAYDETDNTTFFEIAAGDAAVIEAVTANGKMYDVDEPGKVKFVIKDHYGNKIVGNSTTIKAVLLSVPSGSDLETDKDDEVDFVTVNEDDEFVLAIDFDKVGDYKIRANPAGVGVFATITVTAKEVGDVEKMLVKFVKDGKKSLIAGDDVLNNDVDELALEVKSVDVNGIEVDAKDFKAYSSNVGLVEVEVSGDKLTVFGPKDDEKRGVATITVVDIDTGKTASIDVPVVGQPYSIDADYTVSGKDAKVTLQFVDNDGAVTRADADKDYELLLPKGVVVSDKKVFKEDSGEASFKATVDEYGTYDITVVSDQGIAKKFALTIGVPVEEIEVIGAQSVTMFIGSSGYVQDGEARISDVAPFIKDGRTFVAVRPIADAFGCEIGWDEVEQKVSLVRDDVQVTIIIGSSDIEVLEDGVISVVEADVPAYIVDGRTVLPFRAVGEAFGATVDYDAETQSVTYAQ